MLMECHHVELQVFATRCRHMSDFEKRLLLDVTEGCSFPFEVLRQAAQSLLHFFIEALVGCAESLLSLMLGKVRDLIESKNHRGIEGAVETLVKGIVLWKQHCPSRIFDLLVILKDTAALDIPQVPGIATIAKVGIAQLTPPPFPGQMIFPKDEIAIAIRPAGDFSELTKTAPSLQHKDKDKKILRMKHLTIDLLRQYTNPRLCMMFISALIRPNFDLPPVEVVTFLVDNAVTADATLRYDCTLMLADVVEKLLAEISYGGNFKAYLSKQGCRECHLDQVVSVGSSAHTEHYLNEFATIDGGSNSDDGVFIDPAFHGSLVWPAKFYAASRDVAWPNDATETARKAEIIGSLLTKEWFETFLSRLKLEEADQNGQVPVVSTANVELLTYAFQLMDFGMTAAKLEDMEELAKSALEDSTKVGHHIAAATFLLGLLRSPKSCTFRRRVLQIAEPMLIDILEHKMSLAITTWTAVLGQLTKNRDPRRIPGLVQHIRFAQLNDADIRPRNEAKLAALYVVLVNQRWRFPYRREVAAMLLKAKDTIMDVKVSALLGMTLAHIYAHGFHDSWANVSTMVAAHKDASCVRNRAYESSIDLQDTVTELFNRVSALRTQEPIPLLRYQGAAMTALCFVSSMLKTNASGVLVYFSTSMLEDLFLMLDAKLPDKTEVKTYVAAVLEGLCRVPFRGDELAAFWATIVNKTAEIEPVTHRKAALRMVRELYLLRLPISTPDEQSKGLEAVSTKVQDSDSEISTEAAEILKDLLSRSRLRVTEPVVIKLVERNVQVLKDLEALSKQVQQRNSHIQTKATESVEKLYSHQPLGLSGDNTTDTLKLPTMKASHRLAPIRTLVAVITAYPQMIELPKWMAMAMKTLVNEAQLSGPSVDIARTAAWDFKGVRLTEWARSTKVSDDFFFQLVALMHLICLATSCQNSI
jgi:hypothetical protein